MPATTIQTLPAWVPTAIRGNAFNPSMTAQGFREFVQCLYLGATIEQAAEGLETDATPATQQKEARPASRRNSNANAGGATNTETSGNTAKRPRAGSQRDILLNLIHRYPEGITRKDILVALDLKGDKSAEMSVSNAMTANVKGHFAKRVGNKYLTDQWAPLPPTGEVVTLQATG